MNLLQVTALLDSGPFGCRKQQKDTQIRILIGVDLLEYHPVLLGVAALNSVPAGKGKAHRFLRSPSLLYLPVSRKPSTRPSSRSGSMT